MADLKRHEATDQNKDDPATVAASEGLKHARISEKGSNGERVDSSKAEIELVDDDKDMGEPAQRGTPEPKSEQYRDDDLIEHVASPKKKRGRDQDEDSPDLPDDSRDDGSDGSIPKGRKNTSSEPEKKRRPRDISEDRAKTVEESPDPKNKALVDCADTPVPEAEKKTADLSEPVTTETKVPPQSSKSAFAASGFASLAASTTSPFGSIATDKPSVFGGGLSKTSGFGTTKSTTPAISSSVTTTSTSGFGNLGDHKLPSGFGFGSGSTSAFGGGMATGGGFGTKLGSGFGGGSGPKLSSFAAPGTDSKLTTKPARAFGAPESDEEASASDKDDSDRPSEVEEEDFTAGLEERKKMKLTKVHIDDGEAGDVTLLQVRAKIFAIESKDSGWKERGVGSLKINVPKSCVDYDDVGLPVRGSFDLSGLEDDEDDGSSRVVRLIMRQENTHRVILNTIIVKAMDFKDKPSASTAQIMFTAFEGTDLKPTNMLLKMSEANAKLFRSEIDSIQREL